MLIGHTKNTFDFKKLIEENALSHGYIFSGPSMLGKRTFALALANFLENGIFEVPTENQILQDAKIIDRASMKMLDPDASGNSIGIDAAREIKNFLSQRPNVSTRRTLIIDDAVLMTNEAQNAILKVTEEPPVSSLLILIASETEGLLPTILSRLPQISFGTVAQSEIAEWLAVTFPDSCRARAVEGHSKECVLPTAKAVEAAKKSFGKPGLAWRLIFDKEFLENIACAEKFLKASPTVRRDVIKKIIEPDDFNMRAFLDAFILVLAWSDMIKKRPALWHKTMTLYGRITDFSLNPRLQLENLLIDD